MKIAILQMQPFPANPDRNLDKIEKAARSAAASGATLLVTPELSLTGYAPGTDFSTLAETTSGTMANTLKTIAANAGISIVAGMPERDGDAVFNSCIYVTPHDALKCYRKCHLYGEAEKSSFTPSDQMPVVFELNGIQTGMLICFDVEFPEMVRHLALSGADLVIVPTALPSTPDSEIISAKMIATRAMENHVFIAYADLCGSERAMTYYGGSVIVGPDGRDLARAGDSETLLIADLDFIKSNTSALENPYLIERRPDLYGHNHN